MAINSRLNRISDAIKHSIITLLHKEVRDPRLKFISITSVEISKDLRYAKVYFSAHNPTFKIDNILQAFKTASGFFRTHISKKLYLRITPMLHFFYDNSLVYGSKMDKLIHRACNTDMLARSKDED